MVSGGLVVVAYALSGVFLLPFAWLFSSHDTRGSTFMALGAVATALTAVAYAVSLRVPGPTATLAWYHVYLLTIAASNLSFLSFTLVWTDRSGSLRWELVGPLAVVLAGIPLVGLADIAVASVDLRQAFWASPGTVRFAGVTVYNRTPGPVVLVWRLVTTAAALVMLGFLTEFTFRPEQRLYRAQNGLLVGGLFGVVLVATVVQLLGVPLEITPLTYLLLAGTFAVAVGGFGPFDVVPMATNSIIEEIDAGVLTYDTQGVVLDANRNAARALAVSRPAGHALRDLVAASNTLDVDVDGDRDTLEARLDGHEFTVAGDGDERRYSVNVSTISGPRDRAVGRGLVIHDVTEQHRRQRRLEQANERLERFADVVSHDLRNPLQVARAQLTFAREGDAESLDTLETSLDRMDALIDDVLTLAQEGQSVTDPEPVALAPVCWAAWGQVATDDATLVVDTDATVAADRDRLVRLFENLFRNAREHAGDDVTVTVGVDDALYVEDDGPGIPGDERERVFESGYSTTQGTTGFGLAIVEQIADAHGWAVRVTDGADGGARFEFTGVALVSG